MISPLIPKSDWLLISHYSITLESNVKVMKIIEIVSVQNINIIVWV